MHHRFTRFVRRDNSPDDAEREYRKAYEIPDRPLRTILVWRYLPIVSIHVRRGELNAYFSDLACQLLGRYVAANTHLLGITLSDPVAASMLGDFYFADFNHTRGLNFNGAAGTTDCDEASDFVEIDGNDGDGTTQVTVEQRGRSVFDGRIRTSQFHRRRHRNSRGRHWQP